VEEEIDIFNQKNFLVFISTEKDFDPRT